MFHDFRSDYRRHNTPTAVHELASFTKHAAIWLFVSFAVTALVWASNTAVGYLR